MEEVCALEAFQSGQLERRAMSQQHEKVDVDCSALPRAGRPLQGETQGLGASPGISYSARDTGQVTSLISSSKPVAPGLCVSAAEWGLSGAGIGDKWPGLGNDKAAEALPPTVHSSLSLWSRPVILGNSKQALFAAHLGCSACDRAVRASVPSLGDGGWTLQRTAQMAVGGCWRAGPGPACPSLMVRESVMGEQVHARRGGSPW